LTGIAIWYVAASFRGTMINLSQVLENVKEVKTQHLRSLAGSLILFVSDVDGGAKRL
jgi:hypothetical protein